MLFTDYDIQMTDAIKVDQEIDTKGTRCPIPLLRAKQALKTMQAGEHLKVLATDPSAKDDFDAMLAHLPHDLIDYQVNVEEEKNIYIITIRKG